MHNANVAHTHCVHWSRQIMSLSAQYACLCACMCKQFVLFVCDNWHFRVFSVFPAQAKIKFAKDL